MQNIFFEKPILNSPYDYPARHWELDGSGQPTQQIIGKRRLADFVTPIPKTRKTKSSAEQIDLMLDGGAGISNAKQAYTKAAEFINNLRTHVDKWR